MGEWAEPGGPFLNRSRQLKSVGRTCESEVKSQTRKVCGRRNCLLQERKNVVLWSVRKVELRRRADSRWFLLCFLFLFVRPLARVRVRAAIGR